MGFGSASTPVFLRTATAVLLDDTRNYAPAAGATFVLDAKSFDGYTPLLIEVISEPTYSWFHAAARLYLPGSTTRFLQKTLMETNGWALFPVQPIGGQMVLRMSNVGTSGGDMTVRVLRARGISDFREIVNAASTGPSSFESPLPAGLTGYAQLAGSASITARVVGVVVLDQIYDVTIRWRDMNYLNITKLEWDEIVATGVPANQPTAIDSPFKGSGMADINVKNTSVSAGTWRSSVHPVALGMGV